MNVLIVDGDFQLLETMKDVCSLEGFSAVTHTSCQFAINDMKAGYLPLIIFCDIFPPGNGGVNFLAELKKRKEWNQIPFILMHSLRGKTTGSPELIKPFSIDEFVKHLELIRPF